MKNERRRNKGERIEELIRSSQEIKLQIDEIVAELGLMSKELTLL